MAFELYCGKNQILGADPTATLRKTGHIGLNKAAMDAHFQNAGHAHLLFDRKTNRIAIRPLKDPDAHSYRVAMLKGCAQINAKSFLKHYGVEVPATRRVPATWDAKLTALILKCKPETGH